VSAALPGPGERPLGIYVHLPWCVRRCPYCDFNAHALTGELPRQPYLAALLADLATNAEDVGEREVATVFFGGGTPSLFPAEDIAAVLAHIRELFPVAEDHEVTLEANPGTMEHDRFLAYRDAGVNRVSLGIQSLQPEALKVLGRIHDADEAQRALADANSVFRTWNADLMYGLPGQTPETAAADVRGVLAHQPPHVSYYQLTIEPNTPFHHQPPALPDDETCWEIQQTGSGMLMAAGLADYEVSAWARPQHACRHNLHYWTWGDFIGVGAGAHGKLTDRHGAVTRTERARNPNLYIKGGEAQRRRALAPNEVLFEFMLNRLRLRRPFDRAELAAGLGDAIALAEPLLAAATADGLLRHEGDSWRHSEHGWSFLNDLQERFLA